MSERVDATMEAACYFVVSEALTNVVKYAEASSVSVDLTVTDDTLVGRSRTTGSGARSSTAARACVVSATAFTRLVGASR